MLDTVQISDEILCPLDFVWQCPGSICLLYLPWLRLVVCFHANRSAFAGEVCLDVSELEKLSKFPKDLGIV